MIEFISLGDFEVKNNSQLSDWIEFSLDQEKKRLGELCFIFCDDEYLLKINNKHLKHNTLTDVISFEYSMGDLISGDIFISTERVKENALLFNSDFLEELNRVMIHGVLHFCGYKDKLVEDQLRIRAKEDYYLSLRTF